VLPRPGTAALHHCPENRAEGLAAAAVVQERSRDLRRLSPQHVRWLARVWFQSGWTPADVIHALDHEPSGRQHGYVQAVRSPAGWARARLALWLDSSGRPLPSRSQLAAERHRRDLEDQRRREAARKEPTGYAKGAALARRLLAERARARLPRPDGAQQAHHPAARIEARPGQAADNGTVRDTPPPGTRVCTDIRTGTVLGPTDPRAVRALAEAYEHHKWMPGDVPVLWDGRHDASYVSPAVLDLETKA